MRIDQSMNPSDYIEQSRNKVHKGDNMDWQA
jgi:hypothetical protein